MGRHAEQRMELIDVLTELCAEAHNSHRRAAVLPRRLELGKAPDVERNEQEHKGTPETGAHR
jgi:hypothetical protein